MAPAEAVAKLLGGRRTGSGWVVRCPAHDDRTPSLSVRATADGRLLVHCHAGCSQSAVIDALRGLGLWEDDALQRRPGRGNRSVLPDREESDPAARRRLALDLWQVSRPASGTLVEGYLRSRSLTLVPPTSLRFHEGLRHPTGSRWPTMVALVAGSRDGERMAIHRTFLARDGSGKAPVTPARMMLGPCRGGAVRLSEATNGLMVGEGIETCLAAMQATDRPAWAALSASGLRAMELPDDIRDVTVLADGDETGEAAALACAGRCKREGRRVRIARPPRGMDFNDVLLGRTTCLEEVSS